MSGGNNCDRGVVRQALIAKEAATVRELNGKGSIREEIV
jgi:hypothetical protein